MTGLRVHQFTATLSPRDAVSHHTLEVDLLLREMGYDTALFAQSIHPELRGRAHDFRDHGALAADVLLYQASTGSPVAEYLLGRTEPLILDYHNLTPAEAFDPWEPHVGAELDAGRRQLVRLARHAHRGIADSRYNADELIAAGLSDVVVAPVLFSPPTVDLDRSGDLGDPPTVLFVGRLAPNKCHEDLIAAVAVLRQALPDSRLVLVGTASSHRYEQALRSMADEVCPGGVVFAGSVAAAELTNWYRSADVFLCLSEHEGFCVPVIEAMAAGVPVVALAAAVIPETVGDAAMLLSEKRPVTVAVALECVLTDASLRTELAARGRRRAAAFAPESARPIMRAALAEAIGACR